MPRLESKLIKLRFDGSGFARLRRRVPPSDGGRCAGAHPSRPTCKQSSPRETTSASGSRLDSRFHHPGQLYGSVSVAPRQEYLQSGFLTSGTTHSSTSTPRSRSASPRGWNLVPGFKEIGAGIATPLGLPGRFRDPPFQYRPLETSWDCCGLCGARAESDTTCLRPPPPRLG